MRNYDNAVAIVAEAENRLAQEIIDRYYGTTGELRSLLYTHSRRVAVKAVECGLHLVAKGMKVDIPFVAEAGLLHDIGILRCDAPSIYCTGVEPYICHGIIGRAMLENEGLPRHAMVCERHTGTGLSVADIELQDLPLPRRDMLPVSLEERLVCYADKFFSKSGDPRKEKSIDKVIASMSRHGKDTLDRFLAMHREFASEGQVN